MVHHKLDSEILCWMENLYAKQEKKFFFLNFTVLFNRLFISPQRLFWFIYMIVQWSLCLVIGLLVYTRVCINSEWWQNSKWQIEMGDAPGTLNSDCTQLRLSTSMQSCKQIWEYSFWEYLFCCAYSNYLFLISEAVMVFDVCRRKTL